LYLQLFDMQNDANFFSNEILQPAVYHSTYIVDIEMRLRKTKDTNCLCSLARNINELSNGTRGVR